MDIYSRNTSDMIRYDFIKFTRREKDTMPKVTETPKADDKVSRALEEYRAQLANDDGRGSYGSYKCPIF
jgi:hypothetical protein